MLDVPRSPHTTLLRIVSPIKERMSVDFHVRWEMRKIRNPGLEAQLLAPSLCAMPTSKTETKTISLLLSHSHSHHHSGLFWFGFIFLSSMLPSPISHFLFLFHSLSSSPTLFFPLLASLVLSLNMPTSIWILMLYLCKV